VKKQQFILFGSGILLVLVLFVFGKTIPPKKQDHGSPAPATTGAQFDVKASLTEAKAKLTPDQQSYVNSLESAVVRGDVKNQKVHIFHRLASFWKDSANLFEPYAFYTAEAAKLENSEKSLTFAAQLFLENLRTEDDPAQKTWSFEEAKDLFKRSLALNPANDSAKIGLCSCYIFGPAEAPQQLMEGIQQILEVARRDSSNMYAQFMLGIGGLVSGQLDKAIERLTKVVTNQPSNVEAILMLAEAYERKGDKANAVKWYQASKTYIPNPEVLKEIDSRIEVLK